MICFKDITFCDSDCVAIDCSTKYTEQVKADATRWWGNEEAPIALNNFTKTCADYTTIQYGVVLMRCQPIHKGHQHIIDKIIADGLIPVIILGSAQEYGTKRNPYHPMDRMTMVKILYPDAIIFTLDDADCWDSWYSSLKKAIKLVVTADLSKVTIYLHEKLEDLQNFTFRGVDYTNESYCKMYEIDGMHTTSLPISDIQIRAKSIREDLEGNKQFLDPKIYDFIKTIAKRK